MVTISVDDQKGAAELMKIMLTRIDPDGTHITANNMNEAMKLITDDTQIAFLDIEMPGLNGIEGAKLLQKRFPRLNIVFVTGHTEYAFRSYDVAASAFLAKPVCEQDIEKALTRLRIPIEKKKCPLVVRCSPFAIFVNGETFAFRRGKTGSLFAYLMYRNGSYCTTGELVGILYDGDPDKSGALRQLIMDMKDCLTEIGAQSILVRKYGRIALDMARLEYEGSLNDIPDEFGWL
ncbi:MAG: response regulator [Ruminiclostridium sp.]|nr:response regulator [Ruminiclostridium sp.]